MNLNSFNDIRDYHIPQRNPLNMQILHRMGYRVEQLSDGRYAVWNTNERGNLVQRYTYEISAWKSLPNYVQDVNRATQLPPPFHGAELVMRRVGDLWTVEYRNDGVKVASAQNPALTEALCSAWLAANTWGAASVQHEAQEQTLARERME